MNNPQQRLTQSFDKFYGRTEELNLLRHALEKTRDAEHPVQSILVRGPSGTGKSTLVDRAFSSQKNILLGRGKFEEQRNPKPYAALANAASNVCQQISQLDQEHKAKYLTKVSEQLGQDDINTLVNLLPHFSKLMSQEASKHQKRRRGSMVRSKEGLDSLKYTLRLFLHTICLMERPVVLCLDDLQWIDPATLDLLQYLLRDSQLKHCVFVGCYRDDEVQGDHIVSTWIDSLVASDILPSPQILTIGDLSFDILQRLLVDLLRRDNVEDLVELIYSRTNGNVFHVLQLVDFLQAESLLEYSMSTFQWEFDLDKLRDRTMLSENVVDVVAHKLNLLSRRVTDFLKLCSCIGFRFDEDVVMMVKHALPGSPITDVDACLQIAIDEGLLERCRGNKVRFAHDKIFEAAVKLTENDIELSQVHYNIGVSLLHQFSEGPEDNDFDDRGIFLCTDQLNRSLRIVEKDKDLCIRLAKLNCVAGQRAQAYSAFLPAVEYFQVGVSLLGDSNWQGHYPLSLELYTSLAEMGYCAGHFDVMEPALDAVFANAQNVEDTLRAYIVLIQGRKARSTPLEVIELSLSVVRKLGETIPKNPGGFVTRRILRQTKRMFSSLSDNQLMSLPRMVSGRKATIIQILSELHFDMYQAGMYHLSVVCCCRTAQLTVGEGMAPYSPTALALMGHHMMSARDIEGGFRLASVAKKLAESHFDTESKSRTLFFVGQSLHFREPLSHCLEYWLEGYQIGMRKGAVQTAFHCMGGYSMYYHLSGLPLGPLLSDIENFTKIILEYGQRNALLFQIPLHQCLLNLMGNSDDILDLSKGRAADTRKKLDWDGKMGLETEWSYLLQISFYCENIDVATDMYNKLTRIDYRHHYAMPFFHNRAFFFALVASWNAKRLRKRSLYKQDARKYFGLVEEFVVKHGAINLVHKLHILKAEMMTLEKRKRPEDIHAEFDKAIVKSTKSGFLQDAAVAAHIASRFFAANDAELSREYHERALEYYGSWGAKGLVEYLSKSSKQAATVGAEASLTGRGFRSRQRFDTKIADEHKKIQMTDSFTAGD